jgi:tRNA pseudouridine32 synthase / 23S rRNA pseudouridine746 synthase
MGFFLVLLSVLLLSLLIPLNSGLCMSPRISSASSSSTSYIDFASVLLYADQDIIACNKPPNVLSVPGIYDKDSLASVVASTFKLGNVDKLVVHRLDYHTSGVIVFARNECALRNLHEQFRSKKFSVYKRYRAVVQGALTESLSGEIDLPIGRDISRGPPYNEVSTTHGKNSITSWNVLSRSFESTTLALFPRTGRTHQLRVHLSSIGHPILGDSFYNEAYSEVFMSAGCVHVFCELCSNAICNHPL